MTRAGEQQRVLLAVTHAPVADVYLDVIRELVAAGALVAVLAVGDAGDDQWANVRALSSEGLVEVLPTPDASWSTAGWAALRGILDVGRYYDEAYAAVPIHRKRYRALLRRQASGRGVAARGALDAALALVDSPVTRGPTLAGLRAVERVLPEPGAIGELLARIRPSIVAVSPLVDFASPLAAYVQAARRRRLPTVALVASWDQLTSKGGLRPAPDLVLVWNEAQRRELVELHGIDYAHSCATGAPRYDRWLARRPERDRATVLRELDLPVTELVLCYAASSPFIGPHEPAFVRKWLHALRAAGSEKLRGASVIVRPHPQALPVWRDASYEELGPVAVYPRDDRIPSRDDAAAQLFFETLAAADALVGLSTTAFLDAGTLGRPSFTVLDDDFADTQRLLHLDLIAANGRCLQTSATLDEHVRQLDAFVRDPEPLRRAARDFALRFLGYEAGRPSSERTATAILELAKTGRCSGGRPWAGDPSGGLGRRQERGDELELGRLDDRQ